MSHLIIAFHPQNFNVELPSCRVWTKLIDWSFFRVFFSDCLSPFPHSKNGQLKCPNTKLLVLLVTADKDCRLIFSIWWINKSWSTVGSTWNWNLTNLEQNYVVLWSFKTGKNFIFPRTEISFFRRWPQECFGEKLFFISKQSLKSLFVISLPYHLTLISKLVFVIIIP